MSDLTPTQVHMFRGSSLKRRSRLAVAAAVVAIGFILVGLFGSLLFQPGGTILYLLFSGPAVALYTVLLRLAAGGRWVNTESILLGVLGGTHILWMFLALAVVQTAFGGLSLVHPFFLTGVVFAAAVAAVTRSWRTLIVMLLAALLAMGWVLSLQSRSEDLVGPVLATTTLHIAITWCLARWAWRRVCDDVERVRGVICLECSYDVRGVGSVCPECGTNITANPSWSLK